MIAVRPALVKHSFQRPRTGACATTASKRRRTECNAAEAGLTQCGRGGVDTISKTAFDW